MFIINFFNNMGELEKTIFVTIVLFLIVIFITVLDILRKKIRENKIINAKTKDPALNKLATMMANSNNMLFKRKNEGKSNFYEYIIEFDNMKVSENSVVVLDEGELLINPKDINILFNFYKTKIQEKKNQDFLEKAKERTNKFISGDYS